MTVKKLREWLDANVPAGSPDERLEIFFGKSRLRKIRKSRVDLKSRKEKTEMKEVLDRRCAWCKKCKNYVKGSQKMSDGKFPMSLVSCRNPRHDEVLENVIEYQGSSCMDYDPEKESDRHTVAREVVVQPAKFKKTDAVMMS